ncbi:carbohydrate binding family 9 domain-containing protein [Flavobacteriaceae bacterium]|nr:carbohydrate binding family 9 domain-containing protein [Flavobacteriaceae bacterium]
MRNSFYTFLFLSLALPSFGQDIYTPPKLQNTIPVIDGQIQAGEWESAEEVLLDFEVDPGNNVSPKEKTIAYISYTDTHLYVAVHAFADPKEIRASVRSRDDFGMIGDDFILLRFDTYTDGRNNYLLLVNPFGSQLDARAINALTDDERYDSSFNLEYETQGTIVSDGYQVEFKIPFSSIPFPNGTDQLWHFNITRQAFRDGIPIDIRSQPFDRTDPCQVCQTTDQLVLKDISIKKRVELLPYVSGGLSGAKETSNGPLKYDNFKPNAGLGLNLDLNKNSTLEVTFNPDFSQVEADVTQIDINSSVALEYPERRPYFNRGTDIVQYTSGAFYSRSINNPLISTKLISQGKKDRIYFLTALDQNSVYQIAGEDRSYLGSGGQSYVNVFRYQRFLNKNARLGFISTNRYFTEGGFGNLLGTDGWFLFSKNWRLTYEFFLNVNKEPIANWIETEDQNFDRSVSLDGERFRGSALYLQLYRNTEHWKSYLSLRDISPNYQADVGFVVKNNRRWATLYHVYQNFPNKEGLQFFSIGTKADVSFTYQDYLKSVSVDGILSLRTFFNTTVNYTYDWDIFKNFLGRNYRNVGKSELQFDSNPSESFSFNFRMTFGKDLAYNEPIPEIGRELTLFFMPGFQLSNKLKLSPSLRYARLKNIQTQSNYFDGAITRFSARYQFNNFFSVRLISEYNTFSERFLIQPLVQWNPNPSTVFYIGGNQNSLDEFNDDLYSLFRLIRRNSF